MFTGLQLNQQHFGKVPVSFLFLHQNRIAFLKEQAFNVLDPYEISFIGSDTFSKKRHILIDQQLTKKLVLWWSIHTHPSYFQNEKRSTYSAVPSIHHRSIQPQIVKRKRKTKTMTIKIVTDKDVFIGIGEISLHSTRSLDDEKITIASEFSFDEEYDYDDCSFSSTGYNDEGDYDVNGATNGGIDEENWDVSAYIGEDSVRLAKYRGLRRKRQNYYSSTASEAVEAGAAPDSPATATTCESTSRDEEDQSSSKAGKDRMTASSPAAKLLTEERKVIYNEYVIDDDDEEIHNTFDCSEEDSVKLASRRRTTTATTTSGSSSPSSTLGCNNSRQRPRKDYSQLLSELGDDIDYEDDLRFPLNDEL